MTSATDARPAAAIPSAPRSGADERSLLIHFELLLECERDMLSARDASGLALLAAERERLTARLAEVARERQNGRHPIAVADAELVELYRRLRQRHDVRARVVRLHGDRNARAIGVLAQAAGQGNLYKSDGSVALQFVAF